MENKNENSQLFKVLNVELKEKGINKQTISEDLKVQNGNLWNMIKKDSVKFKLVCKICDVLGLELIIRNKSKNCEYIINQKQKS